MAVLAGMVLLAGAGSSGAQSTALLRGRVVDPDGGVIVGARITARSAATGIDWTVLTDRAGTYQIAALPPDSHRVTVQAQGFQPAAIESVALAVSTTAIRDFQLRVATVSGIGLISMRERVHFLGGQFTVHSAPGQGTRLELQVPCLSKRTSPV